MNKKTEYVSPEVEIVGVELLNTWDGSTEMPFEPFSF